MAHAQQKKIKPVVADICASFQRWVVDDLVGKALLACQKENIKTLVLAGGVSANALLRATLDKQAKLYGIDVYYPDLKYCTDNAAMVACSAYYSIASGKGWSDGTLCPKPTI